MRKAEIVICGAGIAGISAAFYLARQGVREILLVDRGAPLSLTSDKSTECYRNWWPDPAMVALMNRSIDLLEALADETGNLFHLNRRGYLYVTTDVTLVPALQKQAQHIASLGAGALRVHKGLIASAGYQPAPPEGYKGQPDGADLLIGVDLVHQYFPYLSENAIAALHARRAGWFSAQQLGMYLLEQARRMDVRLIQAGVIGIELAKGQVSGVRLDNGETISTHCFVNAAGPLLQQVGRMLGVELPVYNELHLKAALRDPAEVIPRQAPLVVALDPLHLKWSDEEQQLLAEDNETSWMLEMLPAGAHTRPEGGEGSRTVLLLWEYHPEIMEPVFPPPYDSQYPELALRALANLIPGLGQYLDKSSKPYLDGGYYTRTRENRLLAGPLPVTGAYVLGAFSGYGLMAACAAGELLAAHITGSSLPAYAPAFVLERYNDPAYEEQLKSWGETGQL